MIDKINTSTFGNIRIPEMKGRVDIKLFNAKTGELEQEAHGENMVTNAIRDIFASNYMGKAPYELYMPISTTLMGGVLCFETALTEDADAYYPPANNVSAVTAHAGQTTYASTEADTTRGNPNTSVSGSGVMPHGYKFVWDFASTQGNGTISTVCLTHKDTGDWWLRGGDNYTPVVPPRNDDYYFYEEPRIKVPTLEDKANKITYRLVSGDSNTTTLTVTEILDSGFIQNIGINEKREFNSFVANGVSEITHTVTLPHPVTRGAFIHFAEARQLHYIYVNGSTLSKSIIDLTTWTVTTTTATIANANMPEFTYAGFANTESCRIISLDANGYLYVGGNNNNVYKIKYTNTADVTSVTADFTIRFANAGISGYGNFGICYWGNFVVDGNVIRQIAVPYTTPDSWDYCYPNASWTGTPMLMPTKTNQFRAIQGYNAVLNKLYLATIYNLSTPVSKLSSQTMQITYTITEVEPEEEEEQQEGE